MEKRLVRLAVIVVIFILILSIVSCMKNDVKSDQGQNPVLIEEKCVEEKPEEVQIPVLYTQNDIILIAKTLYGECRGIPSDMEKAAVAWVILNRVDNGAGTITQVVTAPYQFAGYNPNHPILPELYALAEDVLSRWNKEKAGIPDVGRVIPSDYLYFNGDGKRNHFRNKYRGFTRWNWSLPNPYED